MQSNCRNCGAPHDGKKCNYCGTSYSGVSRLNGSMLDVVTPSLAQRMVVNPYTEYMEQKRAKEEAEREAAEEKQRQREALRKILTPTNMIIIVIFSAGMFFRYLWYKKFSKK